jgi:hypothetical protein
MDVDASSPFWQPNSLWQKNMAYFYCRSKTAGRWTTIDLKLNRQHFDEGEMDEYLPIYRSVLIQYSHLNGDDADPADSPCHRLVWYEIGRWKQVQRGRVARIICSTKYNFLAPTMNEYLALSTTSPSDPGLLSCLERNNCSRNGWRVSMGSDSYITWPTQPNGNAVYAAPDRSTKHPNEHVRQIEYCCQCMLWYTLTSEWQ